MANMGSLDIMTDYYYILVNYMCKPYLDSEMTGDIVVGEHTTTMCVPRFDR